MTSVRSYNNTRNNNNNNRNGWNSRTTIHPSKHPFDTRRRRNNKNNPVVHSFSQPSNSCLVVDIELSYYLVGCPLVLLPQLDEFVILFLGRITSQQLVVSHGQPRNWRINSQSFARTHVVKLVCCPYSVVMSSTRRHWPLSANCCSWWWSEQHVEIRSPRPIYFEQEA